MSSDTPNFSRGANICRTRAGRFVSNASPGVEVSYYDAPEFGLPNATPWEVLQRQPAKPKASKRGARPTMSKAAMEAKLKKQNYSSFNTQIPDQKATDRSNSIAGKL